MNDERRAPLADAIHATTADAIGAAIDGHPFTRHAAAQALAEATTSALLDGGPVAELADDRDRLAADLHTARNQAAATLLELGELEADHQALYDAARAVVLWHHNHRRATATLGPRLTELLDHLDAVSHRADQRRAGH